MADRSEELRLYPMIGVLEMLKYATVTDGESYGRYVKITGIAPEGRRALGAHLTMNAPRSIQAEHPGRAWYQRDGDGWRVDDVWLSEDDRDYMWKVTH